VNFADTLHRLADAQFAARTRQDDEEEKDGLAHG
jgi:hypothetical protein